MKPVYTVIDYYVPANQNDKNRKQTKDNYHNFSSFDEVKRFLTSYSKKHKFNINLNELKNKFGSHRFGGKIAKDVFADHCIVVEKGFLPADIANALENKTISFDTRGHNNASFTKGEAASQKYFLKEFSERYARAVGATIKLPDNNFTLDKVYRPIAPGEEIMESECTCWDCEARLQFILVDKKTVSVIDKSYYYDLQDKLCKTLDEKIDFKLNDINLIPKCSGLSFVKSRKMVAHINVPTGKLIFQNHFGENDIIRDKPKGKEYSSPGLNSIAGRNEIMQHLASQNVGFGQMGNMSVGVYTNSKDEIIIGNSYYKDMLGDRENALSGKYDMEFTKEEIDERNNEVRLLRKFDRLLKKGNFKLKGTISLAVWRWMCADKSVYDAAKIKAGEHMDVVKVNVQKGKYKIEHYYDFSKENDPLYSRIKKV